MGVNVEVEAEVEVWVGIEVDVDVQKTTSNPLSKHLYPTINPNMDYGLESILS